MFRKILIANRGEIAVRIIRACREMEIYTVAVYSEGDRDSLHAYMADEAVCIGAANPQDSYLNMHSIINTAVLKQVEAIHPGFGFLSENPEFAKLCEDCNITFIGPSSHCISLLGDKSRAKETMKAAGIPTIPGSDGLISDVDEGIAIANEIGYPVLIKATAGGGGRGIKIVNNDAELKNAFIIAKNEASAFFGNGGLYIEKYLENTRHVEFQIFGDKFGNYVHLGERDCSLQRRNQKIMEESPSPALSPELRERMGETAVKAAQAVGYYNTGTVEFLLDQDKNFYFMEMNTRIQVEHPVTEMVTGIDLIKEQICVAAGRKLSFSQEDVNFRGFSIEARICAEDPEKGFMPTTGKIEYLHIPNGMEIRFDSHIYQGYKIPIYYDSMLGKLIVLGSTRKDALRKLRSALSELVIEGVTTNIDFLSNLLNEPEVVSGRYNTNFINKVLVRNSGIS